MPVASDHASVSADPCRFPKCTELDSIIHDSRDLPFALLHEQKLDNLQGKIC